MNCALTLCVPFSSSLNEQRNDSFDLMLQKKIRNEYVGARMVDGQIVLDDAKDENAKET